MVVHFSLRVNAPHFFINSARARALLASLLPYSFVDLKSFTIKRCWDGLDCKEMEWKPPKRVKTAFLAPSKVIYDVELGF